jgi:hypothetical protein
VIVDRHGSLSAIGHGHRMAAVVVIGRATATAAALMVFVGRPSISGLASLPGSRSTTPL